jgi:hypothetical protein
VADKEVRMKLVVDASSVKAATDAQKKLAEAVKQTGQAAKSAGMGGGGRGASGGGGAGSGGVAGSPLGVAPAAGGGGFQLPGAVKAALGVSAVSGFARSAGNYLTSNFDNPRALSFSGAAGSAIESLPVVGGFASLYNAAGRSRELGVAQYGNDAADRGGLQRQINAGRSQGAATNQEFRRNAENARLQANAGRAFANAVGANPGQFVTEDRQGVSNTATGQVKLEAAQAASEAQAASAVAAAENKRMADAKAAQEQATRERQEAQRRQGETEAAIANKERQIRDTVKTSTLKDTAFGIASNNVGKQKDELADLKKRQEEQSQNTLSKVAAEQQKITEAAKAEENARNASVAAQQKAFAAAQKQLDVDRNRLQVVNAEKGVLEGRARQVAEMSEDEKQQMLEAAKLLKEKKDIQALTPEQRDLVRGSQLYQDVALKQGGEDAIGKEINATLGDRQLSDVTAEAQKLAEGIAAKNAEINAQFQETMATTMETAVKNMADIVVATFKNMEEQLRQEFANAGRIKRNNEAAQ